MCAQVCVKLFNFVLFLFHLNLIEHVLCDPNECPLCLSGRFSAVQAGTIQLPTQVHEKLSLQLPQGCTHLITQRLHLVHCWVKMKVRLLGRRMGGVGVDSLAPPPGWLAKICYTSRNNGPLIHWCSIFNFIVRSAKAITNVQYRWFTSVLTFCLHCLLPVWFSHHFPSNSIKAAIAEINRLTLSLGPNVCQGC